MISRIPVTSARSLAEAHEVLSARPPGLRVLAGGTDFMAALNARVGTERIGHVLDIWQVPELRGIEVRDGFLRIGALTTYAELMRSNEVLSSLPALSAVSREVGAVAIQNRGTLGGNVCNASPAGDTLPLLLAAEARLIVGGPRGERSVPVDEFFLGYRKTALGADELLQRIDLPLLSGARLSYRKVGTRKAQSVSRVLVAVRKGAGPLRIAAGCVGPIPLRCKHAEAAAEQGGDLREALLRDIAPIDDIRATAVYRGRVTANVLLRLLE
ncbi:MAG TPA: FAD binding domain-containing protein [Myxococcales bacterium]|jgi:CO/xanthine dehydrogenase FAD-binding subunit|nr:FAD binding domain-containing protein [Myxococcales bacterium]